MGAGIIFFPEHIRIARAVLKPDELGQLFLAVCDYAEKGDLPSGEHSDAWNACFGLMREAIDRNIARYAEVCERNRRNAKKRSHAVASDGKPPQAAASDGQRSPAAAANNNVTQTKPNVSQAVTQRKQQQRACAREAAAPQTAFNSESMREAAALNLVKHYCLPSCDAASICDDIKLHGMSIVKDTLSRAAMSGPVTLERYRSLLPAVR